jgi:hypothetical protein
MTHQGLLVYLTVKVAELVGVVVVEEVILDPLDRYLRV